MTSLERILKKIETFDPKEVSFAITKGKYVTCFIRGSNWTAYGTAICSVLDDFDEYTGKVKAAGRALKALIRKENSEPTRTRFEDFPPSWEIRQAYRVTSSPTAFKSGFYSPEKVEEALASLRKECC